MPKGFLKIFVITSFVVTFAAFGIYGTAQQILRQEANNPQLEISQNLSVTLSNGSDPKKAVTGVAQVDITKSLSPFVIVYDDNMQVAAFTGTANGHVPTPPRGVFDYAKNVGEDRVTWQLPSGTRIAAVVNRYGGPKPGYVLAGKNLREVERTTDNIFKLTLLGWSGGLVIAALLSLILSKNK